MFTAGYATDAGHAQALAMVDGALFEVDLTIKAENSDLDSANIIDWHWRNQACRTVSTLPRQEVYRLACELREVLTGKRSIETTSIPRPKITILSKSTGLREELLHKVTKELTSTSSSNDTTWLEHRDSLPLPGFYRAYNVLVTAKTLNAVIEESKLAAQVSAITDYVSQEHRALEQISAHEREYLPNQYKEFNRDELIQRGEVYVIQALASGSLPPNESLVGQAWLGRRLPIFSPYDFAGVCSGSLSDYACGHMPKDCLMSLNALEEIVRCDLLGKVDSLERAALIQQMLAYFAVAKGARCPNRNLVESDEEKAAFELTITYLHGYLTGDPIQYNEAEHLRVFCLLLLNVHTAHLVGQETGSPLGTKIIECCRVVNEANPDSALSTIRQLVFFNINTDFPEEFEALLGNSFDNTLFLGSVFTTHSQVLLKMLSSNIQQQLQSCRLSEANLTYWKRVANILSSADLTLGQICDADKVLRVLTENLSWLVAQKSLTVNYPDSSTPASSFIARVTDLPESRLIELFDLFKNDGLIAGQTLKDIWPPQSEGELVTQLMRDLVFVDRNQSSSVSVEYKHRDRRSGIYLENSEVLLGAVVKKYPLIEPLFELLVARGEFDADYGAEFSQMRKMFPISWAQGLQCLSQGEGLRGDVQLALGCALTRLAFEKAVPEKQGQGTFIDKAAVYEAILWYAASVNGISLDQRAPLRLKAMSNLNGEAFGDPFLDSRELFPQSLQITDHESRVMVAIGSAITGQGLNTAMGRGIVKAFHSSCAIDVLTTYLLSYGGDGAQGQPPNSRVREIWSRLYRKSNDVDVDLFALLKKVGHGIDFLNQSSHAPFAQYLHARTGQVIVEAPAGEFKELKQFNAGDDYRRIDWRSSARKGNLYMRTHEEVESRPLCLLYDVEYLSDGLKHPTPKPLLDMLTILSLAAREGQEVDIVLYGRSYLTTIKDVVKLGDGRTGSVDTKKISDELLPYLGTAYTIHAMEQAIYDNAEGYPGVNIFEGTSLQLPRNAVVLCGISQKNFLQSAPMLGVFRSKGVSIHRLLPQK
jgi:hypothetical protein